MVGFGAMRHAWNRAVRQAPQPTLRLCQIANAPPARLQARGPRSAPGALLSSSPRKRGGRAPVGAGAEIGRTRGVPGHAMTPGRRAPNEAGRAPAGALPRHFHESVLAHESLPDQGALFRALSQPVDARLRVLVPAGSEPEAAPGASGAKPRPAGSAAPRSASAATGGALERAGWL